MIVMRRMFLPGLTTLATLMVVPLAHAQDTAVAVSWFAQFFWSDLLLGLTIIWFLLALSAVSIGYTIRVALLYRKSVVLPMATRAGVEELIAVKKYRQAIALADADPSYLGTVTAAGLREAANGYAAMERAIEEMGDAQTTRILRPLEYLNVLGNIAPMLGLFGTVYGMIVAFQQLVASGGSPDPAQLAGGISTALVTTFWGLVVAMPALTAYALMRNKIDALTSEGMILAEELISPFKPSPQISAKPTKSK